MSDVDRPSMTKMNDPKTALSVIIWILPIIFGAGGAWVMLSSAQGRVSELERRIQDHEKQDVQVLLKARMDDVERRMKEVENGQRDVTDSLTKLNIRIEQVNGNIIALCTATTGAKCVR